MALLKEAVDAARAVIDERRPDMDQDTRAQVAHQIGIGAVKYADLSVAHDSDYIFDLDRMLALSGNTGPYMQYAAARIRSIFRNAGLDPASQSAPIGVGEAAERALALKLLDFGSVVARVGDDLAPHLLCAYLFELSQAFSTFYETCPVLKADGDVRASRLSLCALTLRVIVQGLDLLGVAAPQEI
jgi:arginyl-tRNA synthetase